MLLDDFSKKALDLVAVKVSQARLGQRISAERLQVSEEDKIGDIGVFMGCHLLCKACLRPFPTTSLVLEWQGGPRSFGFTTLYAGPFVART